MESIARFFEDLYKKFNARQIDQLILQMTTDVSWANGMEGGHVHGHNAVREYWRRQFEIIDSKVTPVTIDIKNDRIKIKVHQVVHDLAGNLLADEFVYHHFYLRENKIVRFDIGDKIKSI